MQGALFILSHHIIFRMKREWEMQDSLMVKTLDWKSEDLGSVPGSARELLGDLGQVTVQLCALVSPPTVRL